MKQICAFIFLVLYGVVVMASPIAENECTKATFQKKQQSTHSCCNQPATHKGCCPDHQCQVRTDDNAVEIVAYKEFNPQILLFVSLSASGQANQIYSQLSSWDNTVSFNLHKIRIHLYNKVLRI